MAIGCIQAQRCHTGHCPTGVATQTRGSMRGLDPQLKSVRLANYMRALRGELLALARTCGVHAPGARRPRTASRSSPSASRGAPLHEVFGYEPGWAVPPPARRAEIEALMSARTAWRAAGPELGPVPGDGTGGDARPALRLAGAAAALPACLAETAHNRTRPLQTASGRDGRVRSSACASAPSARRAAARARRPGTPSSSSRLRSRSAFSSIPSSSARFVIHIHTSSATTPPSVPYVLS